MSRQPLQENNGERGSSRVPYFTSLWSRLLSLGLAFALASLGIDRAELLAQAVPGIRTGVLVVMMWGIATGFIHGVGFVPRLSVWRLIFHPLLGWAWIASALLWLVRAA